MKKLLTILSSVFLTASSSAVVTNVVSCATKPSKAINDAVAKNATELLEKKDYEYYEIKDNNLEIKPSTSFSDDDKTRIASETLAGFKAAISYFDKTLNIRMPKDDKDDAAKTWLEWTKKDVENDGSTPSNKLDDEKKYQDGDSEKAEKYSLRDKILRLLGDAVTSKDFQVAVAQLAVAKNNAVFIQGVKLESEDDNKALKEMGSYLSKGIFIPVFKVVNEGVVRTQGVSKIMIKFEKKLVNFLQPVTSLDFLKGDLKYKGKEISQLDATEKKELIKAINDEKIQRFYKYGDLGGNN